MPRPKNEKYKVGDTVRIRSDFDRRKRYNDMGVNEHMEDRKGKVVYIINSRADGYYNSPIYTIEVDGRRDGWDWTNDMFVEVNRK